MGPPFLPTPNANFCRATQLKAQSPTPYRRRPSVLSCSFSACRWSFQGSAGRPRIFTTASVKKRKLSPSGGSVTDQTVETTVLHDDHPPLAPPLSSPHPQRADTARPPSVSPPRYIPPHLHEEVFDGPSESRYVSGDPTASAASSPSEAYAGLTLDSADTVMSMNGSEQEHLDSTAARQTYSEIPSPGSRTTQKEGSPRSSLRSSSPTKRTAAVMEGTQEPEPRATAAPSATNANNSTPSTSSSTNQASNNSSTAATSVADSPPRQSVEGGLDMSLDEQVVKVTRIVEEPIVEGQDGYLVSNKWLERVLARTSDGLSSKDFDPSAREGDIGPVDNSDLVWKEALEEGIRDADGEEFVPLKPGLTFGSDYTVFPTEAWQLVLQVYGLKDGSPVIKRRAHDTSPDATGENIQYEIYPPVFTIRKLRNDSAGVTRQSLVEKNAVPPKLVFSQQDRFQNFLKKAKEAAGIDMKTKVQLWRAVETAEAGQPLEQDNLQSGDNSAGPSQRSVTKEKLVMDVMEFTNLEEGTQREMVDHKDETANEKYNGRSTLSMLGLGTSQTLILEEQIGGPGGGEFVSANARKSAAKNGVSIAADKASSKAVVKSVADGRSSSASNGPTTGGRTARSGRTRGTVGLTNLGNTCYMNSALQCIRSVEELTIYFLEQKYKEEINSDNPLGHGGSMAKAYAGLLAAIYDDSASSSFSPKNFKSALGRAQPLFSGYGQQDSQEFLSFLVDAVHEDLNRIRKKPYVENPESDDKTVGDPEAIKALGDKFREIHHARNDSVAMDLFNGFYKNTMVCPDCDKVSITFDPYSLVTLQLPVEQTWQHKVLLAPLRGRPIAIEVDLSKNSTIRSLKEYVAQKVPGLRWDRLMCSETYGSKFYRHLEDNLTIAESNIQDRDVIVLYELERKPTNFPAPKRKKVRSMLSFNASSDDEIPDASSPLADQLLVPVFNRVQTSSSYSNNKPLKLEPFFIVVDREEAQNYDEILRKLIAKVATMTSRDIVEEITGNSNSVLSRTGSEPVLTTDDDASSTVDSNVQARSVEGEDGMVDVSMTGTGDAKTTQSSELPDSRPANDLPELLRPGAFIPPEFRNMFAVKYSRGSKEFLPTGWSAVDHNKEYPLLESRMPVAPSSRRSSFQSETNSRSSGSGSEGTEATDANDDQFHFSAPPEPFEQPGDSDGSPPPEKFNNRRRNQKFGKKRGKKGRPVTYGRKGKPRHAARQASEQPSEPDDNPALIRLGEAIVLDWNADAFEALFEGVDSSDNRGVSTWNNIETLEDPELQAKRVKRAARKKSGITLEECFAETGKSEILSEENAWYCNRCKELRRASKTLEIWTAPDILVIHLKRFSANRGLRDKLDVLVDFPIEGLDLSDRVGLPEGKELIYDLFAVDNHYGGLGGGHYTACAQNFYDKQWYEYNDSQVSKRNPQSVVTPAAYLLFYRRRSDRPLGPPYLQQLVEKHYSQTADSEADSSSRSGSPNGRRLGGSSQNGSSNALAGAGARVGRPRDTAGAGSTSADGLAGLAAGSQARNGGMGDDDMDADTETTASLTDNALVPLPGYDVGLDDDVPPPAYDDEGYADADELNATFNSYQQPPWSAAEPSWGFTGALGRPDAANTDDEALETDVASDVAAGGSDLGEAGEDRMMTDFGDDLFATAQGSFGGERAGQTSRMPTPLSEEDDMPPLAGAERADGAFVVGMEDVGPSEQDDVVHEVRLDEDDTVSPPTLAPSTTEPAASLAKKTPPPMGA